MLGRLEWWTGRVIGRSTRRRVNHGPLGVFEEPWTCRSRSGERWEALGSYRKSPWYGFRQIGTRGGGDGMLGQRHRAIPHCSRCRWFVAPRCGSSSMWNGLCSAPCMRGSDRSPWTRNRKLECGDFAPQRGRWLHRLMSLALLSLVLAVLVVVLSEFMAVFRIAFR
jgi:hypothetical protein